MRTTNYDLPNAQYNRAYYAITIEFPNTYNFYLSDIWLHVKTKVDGKIIKTFSTAEGGITLDSENAGKFIIDQHLCDLQPGEYMYDILITDINDIPDLNRSYIAGNWIVEETITYKA